MLNLKVPSVWVSVADPAVLTRRSCRHRTAELTLMWLPRAAKVRFAGDYSLSLKVRRNNVQRRAATPPAVGAAHLNATAARFTLHAQRSGVGGGSAGEWGVAKLMRGQPPANLPERPPACGSV